MNAPKFSITIPAYKSTFLKEAIISCLNQSYSDFELIIVDDASPENIQEIVSPFISNPYVRFFRNDTNCGAEHVVDNWNICLRHCSGEWVICMGDDDVLMPNCLEEYVKAIESFPNVDILHARVKQIGEKGDLIQVLPERPEYESDYSFIAERLRGRVQYIGDFCFRTERLKAEGGFYYLPFAWGSDDISSFICVTPNGIANVNVPVFCYRRNRYSISRYGNFQNKLEAICLEEEWLIEYVKRQQVRMESQDEDLSVLEQSISNGMNNYRCWALCENLSILGIIRFSLCHHKKYHITIRTFFMAIYRRVINRLLLLLFKTSSL